MFRNQFKRLCQVVAISGTSVLIGIQYERQKKNNDNSVFLGGMPIFGTVLAATPLTETRLSPVVVQPEVAIPEKDKLSVIPPEPVPGRNRISEIMRFGFPGFDNIRSHSDYVLSYDRQKRVAHWVFEHLTKDSVRRNDNVDRQKSEFKEDTSIHPFFRSKNEDYKYSGFDRGHLAAAGNHRANQQVCDETFLLSNMAPQVGVGFNRDKWEHLERYVRGLTKINRNVYVCTGPLYLPFRDTQDGKSYVKYQVIGSDNVAVPTHFFKVLVCENEARDLEMEAYVLPNEKIPDDVPLTSFQVPPDSIERAAGILLFDRISREKLKKINGKKTGWF